MVPNKGLRNANQCLPCGRGLIGRPDVLRQQRRPDNARNVNFNPDDGHVNVNENNPENRNDNLGVARLLRGYWLCADLSQPPSIRPVSASMAWIWNTFVSLASLSSKYRRSFRVAVSSFPPAPMR